MSFPAFDSLRDDVFELLQADGDHRGEALFFGPDDARDVVARVDQIRIGFLHESTTKPESSIEERSFESEQRSLADSAPHDLAQHVAAAFIRRNDAVADQKGGGADVVGDDAQGSVGRRRVCRTARRAFRAASSMIGRSRSVSKLLSLPWRTAAMRSSPMPVSIEGLGSGDRCPFSSRSNCMNTRFQIST